MCKQGLGAHQLYPWTTCCRSLGTNHQAFAKPATPWCCDSSPALRRAKHSNLHGWRIQNLLRLDDLHVFIIGDVPPYVDVNHLVWFAWCFETWLAQTNYQQQATGHTMWYGWFWRMAYPISLEYAIAIHGLRRHWQHAALRWFSVHLGAPGCGFTVEILGQSRVKYAPWRKIGVPKNHQILEICRNLQ